MFRWHMNIYQIYGSGAHLMHLQHWLNSVMSWQSYDTRVSTCPVSQHICLPSSILQLACLPWVALRGTMILFIDSLDTFVVMGRTDRQHRHPRQDGYERTPESSRV
jgi:hypothetical protein